MLENCNIHPFIIFNAHVSFNFGIIFESRAWNDPKALVDRVIQRNLVELYVTRSYREILFGRETSNRKIGIKSQGCSLIRDTPVLNLKLLYL